MRRLMLLFSSLLIGVGLLATAYVSYRHYLVFTRIPKLRLSPQPLTLPLSFDELAVSGMRWVEVEATPAPSSSAAQNHYRDTAESPRTLILQFSDAALDGSERGLTWRKYRGILYTAVNRARPRAVPDPLIRGLKESGISPDTRFAVLMVAESPWLIWKAVIKEFGVLVSGFLIAISLLIQLARRVRALSGLKSLHKPIRPSWIQQRAPTFVLGVCALAIAWAVYLSARSGLVLPIGTIIGFGIGAGLSLFAGAQGHVVRSQTPPMRTNWSAVGSNT